MSENERLDWNEYFMSIAKLASIRSACSRLKVGCVIVKDKHVVSMGYNGFLPSFPHESIIVNNHEQATVHAEQNAIADAACRGTSVKNGTAYITHYPCINCFKILIASGIKEIYYLDDYNNDNIINKLLQKNSSIILKKIENINYL
tara:strand:- start:4379 stop:4816 length:438 start_codon:yes stop_codon:yes gene_type:complete